MDHNHERALIGALMLDPSQLDAIAADLTVADFHDVDLGRLYDALVTLHEAHTPLTDMTILIPKLRAMAVPVAVCAPAFIHSLCTHSFGHHAQYYALEVRKASRLRQQQRVARELSEYATREDADPDQIAGWLECATRSMGTRSSRCRHISEITDEFLKDLREPELHGRPVMTGFIDLDETIGGFSPGELIILAARPGQGKSALAAQCAMHAAARRGSVLYHSLEMTQAELVRRVLQDRAEVNSLYLRSRRLTDEHLARLDAAGAVVSQYPLYVDDSPRVTTQQVRATAKQLSARSTLTLLVLDYIGLLRHPNPKLRKFEQVSDHTADLKAIAKDLHVPVLALCQLNREADGAAPRLSHLRDSGSVEQDADVVLFIHHDRKSSTATLEVAKNRHGQTGSLHLRWVPTRARFESQPNDFAEYGP